MYFAPENNDGYDWYKLAIVTLLTMVPILPVYCAWQTEDWIFQKLLF